MPYKEYHVGGGGNCVFFSTAKQLSPEVHAGIRNELRKMYNSTETGTTVRNSAVDMLTNQFKAGTMNTMLNYELHDYDFKGMDAHHKLVEKIINTENNELNDALALRLLAHLKSPDANLLGRQIGSKMDIYAPITVDYAKGVLTAIESAAPGKPLPTICAVKQQPSGYEISVFRKDETGRVSGENIYGKDRTKKPTDNEINQALADRNIDRTNIIGLKGEKNHCKVYCDTGIAAGENTALAQVTAESRSSIRALAGFFANIGAAIKNIFTQGTRISDTKAYDMTQAGNTHDDMDMGEDVFDELENKKTVENKAEKKAEKTVDDLSSAMDMEDDLEVTLEEKAEQKETQPKKIDVSDSFTATKKPQEHQLTSSKVTEKLFKDKEPSKGPKS